MADPVATVEKIVRIGLKIKEAVDTVRHNEEDCSEIGRRVLRFSAILSQLQQTGMMDGSPALSGALEDLEETLQQALVLVTACQETSTIRRLVTSGELSKKLRRVKDDILNKVMLASFAINAHTTIVLLTIQAGGHNPLTQQPEDATVSDIISCNIHPAEHDARPELNGKEDISLIGTDATFAPLVALRKLSLFELKAAINGGYIIGEGASWKVYKSVLNNGNVVAIKTFKELHQSHWWDPHDQFLLASKLQHKNIVKVLGYGCEVVYRSNDVGSSSMIMRMFKRKKDQVQESLRKYVWVEEYVPNGSLDMIMRDPRLDWPSLSRIIAGLAQGIHYLHENHVVHRDVKPSNILLESDMNPKITDFDLSIVLKDDENEITDTRIAGTFGYLCPEYALRGIVSVKNDVYGFGVTILEAVSTMYASNLPALRYNTTIPYHQGAMKAWSAWVDGRMDELLDPSLFDDSQLMEIKRCTQVGLLCTQDDRADRPTMADVLKMLRGKKELPAPKIPAYFKSSDEEEPVEERPASPSAWSDQSLSPR